MYLGDDASEHTRTSDTRGCKGAQKPFNEMSLLENQSQAEGYEDNDSITHLRWGGTKSEIEGERKRERKRDGRNTRRGQEGNEVAQTERKTEEEIDTAEIFHVGKHS